MLWTKMTTTSPIAQTSYPGELCKMRSLDFTSRIRIQLMHIGRKVLLIEVCPMLPRRSNTFVKENGEVNAAEDIETMVQEISETSCSSTSNCPGSSHTTTMDEEASESVTSSSSKSVSHNEMDSNEMDSKAELNPPETDQSEEVRKQDSSPTGSPDTDSTHKPGAEVPFSTPSTPRCSIPQPSPQDISDSRKEATLIDDINNCFNLGSNKEGGDARTLGNPENVSSSDSSSKVGGVFTF